MAFDYIEEAISKLYALEFADTYLQNNLPEEEVNKIVESFQTDISRIITRFKLRPRDTDRRKRMDI